MHPCALPAAWFATSSSSFELVAYHQPWRLVPQVNLGEQIFPHARSPTPYYLFGVNPCKPRPCRLGKPLRLSIEALFCLSILLHRSNVPGVLVVRVIYFDVAFIFESPNHGKEEQGQETLVLLVRLGQSRANKPSLCPLHWRCPRSLAVGSWCCVAFVTCLSPPAAILMPCFKGHEYLAAEGTGPTSPQSPPLVHGGEMAAARH